MKISDEFNKLLLDNGIDFYSYDEKLQTFIVVFCSISLAYKTLDSLSKIEIPHIK